MIHGLNIWKTLNLYGDLNDLHHIIIMRDISWVLPTSCNSNHDLNHIFLPRRRAPKKKNAISGASTLIIIFDLGNARKTSEHKRRNTYWHPDAVWVPQLQVLTHPRAQADQWASMPVATPGNGPDRNAGSMKTDRRKHSFPSGASGGDASQFSGLKGVQGDVQDVRRDQVSVPRLGLLPELVRLVPVRINAKKRANSKELRYNKVARLALIY